MSEAVTKVYKSTQSEIFSAAQRAIRDLGYKVDRLDRTNGLLTFKTGLSWKSWAGQEMSIMLIDLSSTEVEVSLSGKRNQTGVIVQLYDWGEVNGIANKVLEVMDEYLGVDQDQKEKKSLSGSFEVNEENLDSGQ
ncbi:MAG: hypothetical protein FJY25_08320 [Betaproteobacteria bacterium]|nr:hypothetical protein [Betaproteobacteria bacterium]